MTIHPHPTGHYVLLSDLPPLERALLMAWLTGMAHPVGHPDAVYLEDYLRFVAERKQRRNRRGATRPG
jgi:hypothetical protein